LTNAIWPLTNTEPSIGVTFFGMKFDFNCQLLEQNHSIHLSHSPASN
jgi:hypothetical protein